MLTGKQVTTIFRNVYDLFLKYKDIGTDESSWIEANYDFGKLSENENKSELQTAMLAAVHTELVRRHG